MLRKLPVSSILASGLFMGLLWDFSHFIRMSQQLSRETVNSRPEAILVLTGASERIPKALELLEAQASPLLIISGTARDTTLTDVFNAQASSARNWGALWNKILLESSSTSTVENAMEVNRIVRARGIKQLLLVTSDYHLPRALDVFDLYAPDVEVEGFGVNEKTHSPSSWLDRTWKRGIEYAKYSVFRYRKWLVQSKVFPSLTSHSKVSSG